jgi:hypothetical protein
MGFGDVPADGATFWMFIRFMMLILASLTLSTAAGGA